MHVIVGLGFLGQIWKICLDTCRVIRWLASFKYRKFILTLIADIVYQETNRSSIWFDEQCSSTFHKSVHRRSTNQLDVESNQRKNEIFDKPTMPYHKKYVNKIILL